VKVTVVAVVLALSYFITKPHVVYGPNLHGCFAYGAGTWRSDPCEASREDSVPKYHVVWGDAQ